MSIHIPIRYTKDSSYGKRKIQYFTLKYSSILIPQSLIHIFEIRHILIRKQGALYQLHYETCNQNNKDILEKENISQSFRMNNNE